MILYEYMTYYYNGRCYILQDRLYYKVNEESVIVDKNGSLPHVVSVRGDTESILPEPILPKPESILPEPILPEPEPIMIKKKR